MSLFQRFYKTIALTVAVALLITSWPLGMARANLVTTEQVISETAAAADRDRLVALFERDDVRQQMEALGVDREEALARLAHLSDEEIQQIAGQLDEMPAGQILSGIFVILGLAFLALVITDILGVTDLFPFIRPAI